MDFFQHTQNWIKGEMFEATCIAIAGGIILLLAILAFKFGSSPNASALGIPFTVVGILLLLGGIMMYKGNVKRELEFPEQYKTDTTAFVTAEKTRVQTFSKMYSFGKKMTIGLVIIGLSLAYFTKNPHLKSIGLALVILGISIVFIDHFSKERAATYYAHIEQYLKA